MPLVADRHHELDDGEVTVVQLPSIASQKSVFLKNLQTALHPSGVLGALVPAHAKDVYLVPQVVEEVLRSNLALTILEWENKLKLWGALAINRLTRDAAFYILQRGSVVVDGNVIGTEKVSSTSSRFPSHQSKPSNILPSDFRGPYDWHLDGRGANVVAAWTLFAETPRFQNKLPWSDIRIGHIDTGYTEHSALAWTGGSSTTVRARDGHDYWDDPTKSTVWDDPRDAWLPGFPGHGTRISGAIAGFAIGTSSMPFYGAAPGVGILPFRVTDSVIVDHKKREIALSIEQAVRSGCSVVNISLGALFGSKKLAQALDYAYDNGVIVVCAAGQIWGEVIYPGRYNRCITMGGVGPGLKPWRSAARGQYVDLCGPADQIRRILAEPTLPGVAANKISSKPNGDGTSYATAICSGVAAMWLAWHGTDQLKERYGSTGLWCIPAAFKKLARETATPGNWPAEENSLYGSGIINAGALLMHPLPEPAELIKAKLAADPFDPQD